MKTISFIRNNQQVHNLTIYGFGQAFNLITPLLVIPYIISVCGLTNYGKAAFGMAMVFFLMVFVDFGSDISGVKAVATNRDNPEHLRKILVTTYATKLLMLFVVSAFMSLLFVLVPYFKKDSAMLFLTLPILIGQFLNPSWFLQGIEDFGQITAINILSKVIYVGGIFGFIKLPQDFIYINLWWGIGMIASNAASFYYLYRRFQLNKYQASINEIKAHLASGFPIFSSQIFVSIQLYSPLILIGFLGTAFLAGIYRVVDQVVVMFKTYILVFFNYVFPRVCYLLSTDTREGTRYWLLYNGFNFLFIAASMVLVYCNADRIVDYFTADNHQEIVNLLHLATAIPILMAISVPLKQLVLARNFNKYYVGVTMIVVILNVAMILFLLPTIGIRGVLYALIITELLTSALFILKIKKKPILHRF
jgi:O-antigen/teichoic acid export membrane protein